MPSAALTTFNAAVDASNLNTGAKATAKAWGERLYLAGLKESAEHVRAHLIAEVAERPPSPELTARQQLIVAILNRMRDASDGLALSIAEALD